jgi:hypothetical protein
MKNEIKLYLVKDEHGIVATNEEDGRVDVFDETDDSRKDFVLFMLDEFINKGIKSKDIN